MSELTRLTGVGPKREKALEACGLLTLRDLVYHIPRRYIDRTRLTPIASLAEGDAAYFVARIESVKTPPSRLIVAVSDGEASIELTFFRGASFIRQRLHVGARISVAGTVSRFRDLQIAHPEWAILGEDEDPRGGLLPVYPLTEALSETRAEHKLLQKLALEALDRFDFSDPLKPEERNFLGVRPEKDALRILHAPESFADVAAALAELKRREIWPLAVKRAIARRERLSRGKRFAPAPEAEAKVRAALPFQLTGGQEDVLGRIGSSLENGGQFFGLLHGDVGSGKTAVGLMSVLRVLAAGSQAVLLAPTEILATQHFRTLAPLLEQAGFKAALLTGSTEGGASGERRSIEAGLRSGELSFVIGTHALFSSGTAFRDLRYVLIDEQHRFGVEQRALLSAKGLEPHVLYLSATPIPRTLAQSLYGDLEVLTLGEKPAGRLPVKTRLVPLAKQRELLDFLLAETRTGNQVYWVVPRIDASGNEEDGVAAIDSALKRLRAVGDWKVEAVHGRVPAAERERILSAFRRGEIHALVATTVIEVGVDVPGANLMVVEGGDRFGMAQLHQLRGRTGRGQAQAWCFLLGPAAGWPEETEDRLREFASTEDGFRIAEMDLKRRGAGSLDGTRQSGFGLLRFTDLIEDADLIRDLCERAGEWIAGR